MGKYVVKNFIIGMKINNSNTEAEIILSSKPNPSFPNMETKYGRILFTKPI